MFTRPLLIAACLCSLAPSLYADATADARIGVQASLNAMAATERQNKNVFTAPNVYAPDYTDRDAKGHVVTLKAMENLMDKLREIQKERQNALHLRMVINSVRATIQTLSLQGDTATVTYKHEVTMTGSAPSFPHPVIQNATNVTTTIWKKYGDHWLMERRLASNVTVSRPATPRVAGLGGTPLTTDTKGQMGLSTNIASEVGPSEEFATKFFHDVSAGNMAAAKADMIPYAHRGDPIADVADYVKTHGAITKVTFALADTRSVGKAGLLCELTFADSHEAECELLLDKRVGNNIAIRYNTLSEQQKHDILTKGKWYIDSDRFTD